MKHLAEILAICGASAAALASIAWAGDRRRMRRADLDKVGFMPWTPVFFFSMLGAIILLGLAARAWLGD